MQSPRTPGVGIAGASLGVSYSSRTNTPNSDPAPENQAPRPAAVYQASLIKPRRHRSTRSEVEARRAALLQIVEAMHPMTVRQVFYAATVRGLVEKTEGGYAKVQTDLTLMRRSDELPYGWLADSTRYQRKPRSYLDVDHALRATAELYRRNLWASADAYVEAWIEKDALSGVVYPVTSEYDVPLMSWTCQPTFITLVITIRPVSMPARKSSKPSANWRQMPRFTSNG
jgi:hypothetical protein